MLDFAFVCGILSLNLKNGGTMKLETLVFKQLVRDKYWFDIGQIHLETKKALNRLIKQGLVSKEKAYWPWITSGISQKTLYRPILS